MLEFFKPVTWFAPMWAFACGAVSSGAALGDRLLFVAAGVVLAGPFACAASQAVNDWFDRHVDAINEPQRPIPSGRLPGRWGFYIALFWSGATMLLGAALGPWAFGASIVATALAWMYSAPPFRLKTDGWLGPTAVGFSYEGVAWFTGAAVMLGAFPGWPIVGLAVLYSIGAHGIMTLNDFKAIEGDTRFGVRSLPVQLGPRRAAQVACGVMIAPQIIVALWLLTADAPVHGAALLAVIAAQIALMPTLLRDPRGKAPWYNATGVTLFVSGMMVAAFAVRSLYMVSNGAGV